jgi:hypothetical protein
VVVESSSGRKPKAPVSPAWGSRSTRSTLFPISAKAAPNERQVVVFPTPPLWLATA